MHIALPAAPSGYLKQLRHEGSQLQDMLEALSSNCIQEGQGNLTQRDYQGDNLAGPDFAPPGQETGTYQVNSDCTGSMVINLNVPNVPPGTSSGVINIMFVISDGGRHIHEVVSEFTPPGSSGPAPTQTSADDWKVASAQQ